MTEAATSQNSRQITAGDSAHNASLEPPIQRENVLLQISSLLEGPVRIITIEGEEGIGKTEVLRQFADAYPGKTIPLFISSASRWAYGIDQVTQDLTEHLSKILGREASAVQVDPETEYRRRITSLVRKAKAEKNIYYFVIDGLAGIPAEDKTSLLQIVDLLPFGIDSFRFVIAATADHLQLNNAARRQHQSLLLSHFTREETGRYLDNLSLPADAIGDIYLLSGGLPGRLASIRRILASSQDPVGEIASLPRALPELISREWSQVTGDTTRLLLAILAHQNKRYSVSDLAALTNISATDIEIALRSLGFVTAYEGDVFGFVNEAYRRYAAAELADLSSRVNELFIDSYLASPDHEVALANLTTLLVSEGRFAELIEYLSPERFAKLYQKAPSLRLVQKKADEGIIAAERLKKDSELVRFSLQRCTIEELAASEAMVSEIRARVAVGDTETAFALAESSPRPEVTLRLLVALGRARKERKLEVDPVLLERVESLLQSTSDSLAADQLEPIASDLLFLLPDKAIDLVSKGGTSGDEENAIDWGLARLAIQAQIAERDKDGISRAQAITKRIAHPAARRMSAAATMMMGKASASDALQSIEELESTGHKLFVLRSWMRANRERPDAEVVLESGLKLAIGATGYTANAEVMRELALCLPYLKDAQSVSYYLSAFDSQRSTLERLGPIEDCVRLQLLLARAEARFDQKASHARLEQVYNTVAAIDDRALRTAAVARVLGAIERLSHDDASPALEELRALSAAEFEASAMAVLMASADQVDALRPTLEALAQGQEGLALWLIPQINVEWRRDDAYRVFALTAAQRPTHEIAVPSIAKAAGLIVDPEIRDDAIEAIIRVLAYRTYGREALERITPLLDLVRSVSDALLRAALSAECVRIASTAPESARGASDAEALALLRASWSDLDDNWRKLDAAFGVIDALASGAPEAAKEFVGYANALAARLAIQDAQAAIAASLGLRLAVRAFGGLLRRRLDTSEDFARLYRAISQAGSLEEQAALLSDLALRCEGAGRHSECAEIVAKRLVPLVVAIPESDPARRRAIIRDSAPALYSGGAHSARSLMADMPDVLRDEALMKVAQFRLTKVPPGEPFDRGPRTGFDLNYEDVNVLMALMRDMVNDGAIYDTLEDIADSLAGGSYRDNLKRAQKGLLAQQLVTIVKEKLPSKRFIRHEGYLLASLAQISRFAPEEVPAMAELVERARKIDNIADRAYVLAVIASAMRAKERVAAIEEAKAAVEEIPLLADRIGRFQLLGGLLMDVNATQAKELIRRAFQLAAQGEGETIERRRQAVINLAYRIDPTFAASLATSLDDDPAKKRIERQMALLKLRDSMGEKARNEAPLERERDVTISRASWMKLGALNAKRFAPVPSERAVTFLRHAARQPVSAAYPIFAWYIENAVRHAANTGKARDQVLPLFEACLRGAELAVRAGARTFAQGHPALAFGGGSDGESGGTLIDEGERQEGLKLATRWLQETRPKKLWIIDAYFSPPAVEVLGLVRDACEACELVIFTSRKEALKGTTGNPEDEYRLAWSRVRAGEPPEATIILAGTKKTGSFPIHDRWWLAEDCGLYLGTSYGGIGSRASEMRIVEREEAESRLAEFSKYFSQARVEFKGEKLSYLSFSM